MFFNPQYRFILIKYDFKKGEYDFKVKQVFFDLLCWINTP